MDAPDQNALLACAAVLEALVQDRSHLQKLSADDRQRLLQAAGRVSRPARDEQRALTRAVQKTRDRERRQADEQKLAALQIRRLREQPFTQTPPPGLGAPCLPLADVAEPVIHEDDPVPAQGGATLERERVCYVCKRLYRDLHFFYDQMCVACGEYNYAKRFQKADLRGRVALITGGRVKIGYQAAIMLLRSGAKLIVTTRFPQDAARRFASEVDFPEWQERLHVHGLDLRHTPSVEVFAQYLKDSHSQLDFVIHNACQTVRRPVGFYAHLMEAERTPPHALPEPVRKVLGADSCQLSRALAADARLVTHSAALSQLKLTAEDFNSGDHLFPAGQLDADQQQVDLRATNSWRLALHEISTVELLEVQLVNAIAPFVLNARLRPLMCRTQTRDKHIVNVSAMEGQFYRRFKTDKHPHTNMAKAALNMMTRTSAPDFLKDGIHMNSVDTGWVTDEDPAHIAQRKTAENGFHPPLDVVDGAARIVDPILVGITTGQHPWGLFLKDYRPTDW